MVSKHFDNGGVMVHPEYKPNLLNIRPTASLSKVISETKAHFELIKKMSFSDKALLNEELETFLNSCKKHPEVTSMLCGMIPKNEAEMQTALSVARKFFSYGKGEEGVKKFEKFLCERTDCFFKERSTVLLQRFLKVWLSPKNGKVQKLSPDQLGLFSSDVSMLKGLGVFPETGARTLRGFYGISLSSALNYLSRFRTLNSPNNSSSSLKKYRNESSKEGNLRRICAFKIFLLSYLPKRKLCSKSIAEAIFVTATICSKLTVWKTNRPLPWWISSIEKIIAGRTALMRRAKSYSPHR